MKNQCFWNTLFAIFVALGISCATFFIQSNLSQKKEYRNKEHSNSQHQDLCISTDIDTEVSTTSARVSKIILLKNKFKDLYEGGGFKKSHSPKKNKTAPPYAVGYSVKHRQTTEGNERREYMASPPKRLGSQGHDDENQPGVMSRPKPKSKANPKAKPKINVNPKSKPIQKAKPSQEAKPKLNANPKSISSQKEKPKAKPKLKANPKPAKQGQKIIHHTKDD